VKYSEFGTQLPVTVDGRIGKFLKRVSLGTNFCQMCNKYYGLQTSKGKGYQTNI